MYTRPPSLQTAVSLMKMLADQMDSRESPDPLRLQVLMSDNLWLSSDRATIRQAFDSILFESIDLLGLPRFVLPVEYVAAAIVSFVHPSNYLTACLWSESHGAGADEMSNDGDFDKFTARQLYSLVCLIYAECTDTAFVRFQNKMDLKIKSAIDPFVETSGSNEDE